MVKVVFIDVDGTLISHRTTSVPQSTKDAIKKLREKGIKCVISTGRAMIELEDLPLSDIEFDAYVLLNGQLCLDGNKKIIFGNKMSDTDSLIKLFNEHEMPVQIFEDDTTYINYIDDYVVKSLGDISTSPPPIGELSGKDFYQAVIFIDRNKQDVLQEKLPNCKITRWCTNAVDVISKDAGKVAGMKKYLKYANIKQEETMAFGDGENDIEMIEYVKYGIVMGNGVDCLKDIADYVTDDVDDDGFANAVQHFENLF